MSDRNSMENEVLSSQNQRKGILQKVHQKSHPPNQILIFSCFRMTGYYSTVLVLLFDYIWAFVEDS